MFDDHDVLSCMGLQLAYCHGLLALWAAIDFVNGTGRSAEGGVPREGRTCQSSMSQRASRTSFDEQQPKGSSWAGRANPMRRSRDLVPAMPPPRKFPKVRSTEDRCQRIATSLETDRIRHAPPWPSTAAAVPSLCPTPPAQPSRSTSAPRNKNDPDEANAVPLPTEQPRRAASVDDLNVSAHPYFDGRALDPPSHRVSSPPLLPCTPTTPNTSSRRSSGSWTWTRPSASTPSRSCLGHRPPRRRSGRRGLRRSRVRATPSTT